ncbi:MAG: alpha/beta hydrolase [Sphingomicrobium sp.]
MSKLLASVGLAAIVAGGMAAAQQRRRLPADCRQEIMAICQMGGGMRECVRGALPKLSQGCRAAISERGNSEAPPGSRELAYGPDPKQRLDLLRPVRNSLVPVIVHIHGGGWSIGDKRSAEGAKPEHFAEQGMAFASVNYRLVPASTVEEQAADIANAIAYLRTSGRNMGLDPDRIVLMGHSAGAHLAALVATDPRYLKAAGVPMSAVKGVVLLDGAGYDVARQMARPRNPVAGMYDAAFGRDPARQRALSPTFHAAAPNVAHWLILPVASRGDSTAQSEQLAAALTGAGADARVVPVPNSTHGKLNQQLGRAGDFATVEVDRFLQSVVGYHDAVELPVNAPPLPYPDVRACGIVGSNRWHATAAGLGNNQYRLTISGEVVTKPSTSLRLKLSPEVDASNPPQRGISLLASMPTGPSVDMAVGKTVSGQWTINGPIGTVRVGCGVKVIATIDATMIR